MNFGGSILAKRLILPIILMSSFLTLFLTAFQLYKDFVNGERDLTNSFETIDQSYLRPLQNSVWRVDKSQINLITSGILKLYGIAYLELNLYGIEKIIKGDQPKSRSLSKKWKLYSDDRSEIGEITAVVSYEDIFEELKSKIILILFSNFFKTLIIVIFMYFLYKKYIIDRILNLTEKINDIDFSQRDLNLSKIHKASDSSKNHIKFDEIVQLDDTLEKMIIKLKESFSEIEGLSFHLLSTQEDERQRMAKELHDGIGQILNASKMNLKLAQDEKSDYLTHLEHSINGIDQASNELREIYSGLYPTILTDFGLTKAIEWYCNQVFSATKIDFNLELDFDPKLAKDREIHIYRIIQEITSNIIKHSQATKGGLAINLNHNNHLILLIWDNGVGIKDTTQKDQRAHYGLSNIKHRISYLNGKLNLITSEENGTHYKILVPLN